MCGVPITAALVDNNADLPDDLVNNGGRAYIVVDDKDSHTSLPAERDDPSYFLSYGAFCVDCRVHARDQSEHNQTVMFQSCLG